MKLVSALKMGSATTDAQAEDMLASVGIIPKNGWIADYPMTATIVGDLQSTVVAAAAAKKIPLDKDEALTAYQSVTAEFGLTAVPAPPPRSAYVYPPPGGNPAGAWVLVPGQWVEGRWIPSHRAWAPANR